MILESRIIALVPNQTTRLQLQSIRHIMFQKKGIASALAWDAAIPLYEPATAPSKDRVMQLLEPGPGTVRRSPVFHTGAPVLTGSHLFLAAEPSEPLVQLKTALAGLPRGQNSPFPMEVGLFFCEKESEETEAVGQILRKEPSLPLQWKSSRIALYTIRYDTESRYWWDGAEWDELWQFPIRRWGEFGASLKNA